MISGRSWTWPSQNAFVVTHRNELSVLFRVTGGARVGFGHVRRSWTLASRLAAEGATVRFVAADPEGAVLLRTVGFTVSAESRPGRLDETVRALQEVSRRDVCVVDDPTVPSEALSTLRELAPVVCIDDTCERVFPVDLVVNGSVGAKNLPYRGAPNTRYLLGPNYILLRPSFAEAPARSAPSATIRRVLVLTGGGDAGPLPQRIVGVIVETLPMARIDVVTGPFGTPPVFAGALGGRVTFHRDPEDLRALMLAADLAVSGGGQTAYELAATGTPTIGMQLARDQAINLRSLSRAGILQDIGSPADAAFSERLARALWELAQDPHARDAMTFAGHGLVDGQGAERVAAEVRTLVSTDFCRA